VSDSSQISEIYAIFAIFCAEMTLDFTYLDNLVYTPPASLHLMRSSQW